MRYASTPMTPLYMMVKVRYFLDSSDTKKLLPPLNEPFVFTVIMTTVTSMISTVIKDKRLHALNDTKKLLKPMSKPLNLILAKMIGIVSASVVLFAAKETFFATWNGVKKPSRPTMKLFSLKWSKLTLPVIISLMLNVARAMFFAISNNTREVLQSTRKQFTTTLKMCMGIMLKDVLSVILSGVKRPLLFLTKPFSLNPNTHMLTNTRRTYYIALRGMRKPL